MSKFKKKFCDQFGHIKCKTIKKWTDEIKDAISKERVEKAKAEILRHRKIAQDVEKIINRVKYTH